MGKVFRVYAANGPNRDMELDLPATDYEMLDMMERLQLAPGNLPYMEVLDHQGFDYLDVHMPELPDIYQLNDLAKHLAELDSSGMAAFEGLVGMEMQKTKEAIPLLRLIDFAGSTDCCYVAEDAMTDYELGRFLAENDFVPDIEDLPESTFELLDFSKIGREHRELSGGVFTSLGYVEQHSAPKNISGEIDFRPRKPPYTILLNMAALPLDRLLQKEDMVQLELPASEKQVQATLEKLGRKDWKDVVASILDCPIPRLSHQMLLDNEIPQVLELARCLRELDVQGDMPKYKALLEAEDCSQPALAVALASKIDEYGLMPDIRTPEEAARGDLGISIDPITLGRLMPYVDLYGYGKDVLERFDARLTSYGWLDRSTGQEMEEEQSTEMTVQ